MSVKSVQWDLESNMKQTKEKEVHVEFWWRSPFQSGAPGQKADMDGGNDIKMGLAEISMSM
jgi:hypothetical protein